jgi:hypothetical protein
VFKTARCDSQLSIGHMHNLPALYLSAEPHTALWHAVRALAFADLKSDHAQSVPAHVRARQNYGAALGKIRSLMEENRGLDNDSVLCAILLIDDFEVSTSVFSGYGI